MKTTRYFEEQVLRKRPYIRREWCEEVLARPLGREVQPDGPIRFWGMIAEFGGRALRVVTLADGETIHEVRRVDFPPITARPLMQEQLVDIPMATTNDVAPPGNHLCLQVDVPEAMRARLARHGVAALGVVPIDHRPRFFIADPFGNSIELTQILGPFTPVDE